MSVDTVRQFLAGRAPDIAVIEVEASTATVPEAATALGVAPGQIAKTLSLRVDGGVILIVVRGDARLDNRKYKDTFRGKARFLDAAEVEAATGHPIGGVCPFGVPDGVRIYCDVSLRDFAEVFPAAGASRAAVRITPERLATLVGAEWIDVTQARDVPRN